MIPALRQRRLFVLYAALWLCAGCSVIGLTVGHKYDSSRPPVTVTEWYDIVTARPGSPMVVMLRDGETVEGTFNGFSELPDSDYAALYDDMKRSIFITGYIPAVGDSVSCMLLSGTLVNGRLIGFDWGYMLLSLPVAGERRKVPLTQIDCVTDGLGDRISGDTLKQYIDWGELPLVRTVRLQTDMGEMAVMPHEVSKVSCVTTARKPIYGKVFGFLIGAAVDVILIITLIPEDMN